MPNHISIESLGAQVLNASTSGDELLYLSPLSQVNKPARGGVPVIFPQFAEHGPLIKHGFARHITWDFVDEQHLPDSQEKKYSLQISPKTFLDWPHSACLELICKVSGNGFYQELRVTNSGVQAFKWTGGLHPYFAVSDLLEATLSGLRGIPYEDRYNLGCHIWTSDVMTFSESPCEKLFAGVPPLKLLTNSRRLSISATGFTQWMIWNPGREEASLSDLPQDAWKSFLCIEPVNVSAPIWLEPGESFVGTLEASLV